MRNYKKDFMLVLAASLLMSSASADVSPTSDNKFYVSGSYGISLNRNKPSYGEDYENEKKPTKAPVASVGVGYKFNENFRSELQYSHFGSSSYKADSIVPDNEIQHKVRSRALFTNLYYDFSTTNKWSPYVMLGVGYAQNKATEATIHEDGEPTDLTYAGKSKNSFAWNVGTGLSYKVSDKVYWDVVQYKYSDLGKYSTKAFDEETPALTGKVKNHTFTTGVRISF